MIVQPHPTLPGAVREALFRRDQPLVQRVRLLVKRAHAILSLPLVVWFVFTSNRIHPDYGLTWRKKFALGRRMYLNTTRVPTGTSYRASLVMAAKLFETPPDVEGVVVECGCFLGGTTVNLSIACEMVGRRLIVYDSFEGLPPADPTDKYGNPVGAGALAAGVEAVKANVARHGVIDVCEFRQGWFSETLPDHTEPIVLCFLDVDYQSSTHDCLVNLWPHLTPTGHLFTDDYTHLDLCAVYWSEEFWREYLDTTPPGLVGAGTGVAVGQFWVGPFLRRGGNPAYPLQAPGSTAYTRKDFSGHWDYRRTGDTP